MNHLLNDLSTAVKDIITEHEIIEHSKHKKRETFILYVRNIIVCATTVLFLISLFPVSHIGVLRGCAYILGAMAYFCEILLLTDFFSAKLPHRELFMVYCFSPLYILMGISYFISH